MQIPPILSFVSGKFMNISLWVMFANGEYYTPKIQKHKSQSFMKTLTRFSRGRKAENHENPAFFRKKREEKKEKPELIDRMERMAFWLHRFYYKPF